MHKSQWTNVLSLLAVMVIVDGRVYKNEVDTFVSEAVALDKILNKETSFTNKLAFDWFVTKRDEIKTWGKPDGKKRHMIKHILALREHPHRKDILASMHRIALR